MRHARLASWLLQKAALLPNHPDQAGGNGGRPDFLARSAKALRALTLKLGFDPACKVRVAGMRIPLLLPLSHQLPFYRSRHSQYDRLPEALAAYLRRSRGSLHLIDIGANVGDTILSTAPGCGDRYLAIEPHPDFFPYLEANTMLLPGVKCLQVACGESEGRLGFKQSARGTAAPVNTSDSNHDVAVRPLDVIWANEWAGATVDLLKIDTDGFDVSVLMGASHLLREQHPWVLYECDFFLTEGGIDRHLELTRKLDSLGYSELICYDNLGNFHGIYRLNDEPALRALLSQQSRQGPVHYHDILLVPSSETAQDFLSWKDGRTTNS